MWVRQRVVGRRCWAERIKREDIRRSIAFSRVRRAEMEGCPTRVESRKAKAPVLGWKAISFEIAVERRFMCGMGAEVEAEAKWIAECVVVSRPS